MMNISGMSSPYAITTIDPWLEPFSGEIDLRMNRFKERRAQLVGDAKELISFANGHLYFGIHRTETGWAVREWLPAADEVLTDDMTAAGFAEIQRTRSDVKSFGYIAPASENEDATYYDLADLKDLASNFEDTYPAAAKKVMDAVDAMVVHHYASVSHASGVSFYFPLQNKWMYLGGTDILSATNFSRQYAPNSTSFFPCVGLQTV